ncbi:hypothetical protein IP88_15675 [alpha proteobacterium AAP81b]|nr:hypothetical protein IP88_15675 [alpha proteobacterium AAP81b]
MFIRLTDTLSVAPQIAPDDCAIAATQGFATIVNNRPDGEAPGQPAGAAIAAAAAAAGLAYHAIPVGPAGMGPGEVAAMAAAIAASPGPVLAFCRSGTRSTHLWALAAAQAGGDIEAICDAAEAGGYDVAGLMPVMRRLAMASQ